MTDRLIAANARAVSPRQFLDALGMDSPEKRTARQALLREQCIRAIEAGDTFGWPPLLVEECREIMAQRAALEDDLRFTMELQRKDRAA